MDILLILSSYFLRKNIFRWGKIHFYSTFSSFFSYIYSMNTDEWNYKLIIIFLYLQWFFRFWCSSLYQTSYRMLNYSWISWKKKSLEKLIKNVKLNLSEEEMESNLIRIFFYIHIFWLNIKILYVYVVPVRNWVLKDTLGGDIYHLPYIVCWLAL